MRMSALMNLPVTYVLTHDSIGVGEDGPTHEPIEQLAALRSMPNMNVFRPADLRETVAAYVSALTSKCPTSIVCSRQNLVQLETSGQDALRGGYIVADCEGKPDVILIATGSEVGISLEAKKQLDAQGVMTRVVSMPCCELFDAQNEKYRNHVLLPSVRARVAVEAGCTATWYKYVGLDGKVVGIDTFGASAPADQLMAHYGFTVENVVANALAVVKK
jgi:transketolase